MPYILAFHCYDKILEKIVSKGEDSFWLLVSVHSSVILLFLMARKTRPWNCMSKESCLQHGTQKAKTKKKGHRLA